MSIPSGAFSEGRTYSASGNGYAAYATPTDLFCLSGADGKLVVVTNMWLAGQSTAAAAQLIDFLKRSAPNTGGTKTNPTPFKYDSESPPASAVVSLYSVIPAALGASLGVHKSISSATSAVTGSGTQAGPFNNSIGGPQGIISAQDLRGPIVLRGANESYCCNYRGAALPAGFTSTWFIEWVEFEI